MKLFNIHDTARFYKTVDACAEPVLVTASNGATEDFRNNTLLREMLETASHGSIPEIELHSNCPEDVKRLLDYVMYGYNFSELEKKSA